MPRAAAAPQQPSTDAKSRPARSTRRDVDTTNHKVGQDNKRAMKSRGPARESLEPARVEAVDRVVSNEKLETLRFMEEELEIVVHESTDKNADPMPTVWNDGRPQRFMRGKPQKVKRKYVEVLARAKHTTYSQEKYKDGNGDDAIRQVPHTALLYPFSVIRDPSGDKGAAWLRAVLSEA